jgi:hypothetical protein
MPGKRQAGWPFSLVTFSLATQRESNSAAKGRRKLLSSECRRQNKSIAYGARSCSRKRANVLRPDSNVKVTSAERYQWPAGNPSARTAFTTQRSCTPWRLS